MGTLCALVGESDTGKSSLLRQLALSLVYGDSDFLGFKLKESCRNVIYVSTEDGEMATSVWLNKHFGKDQAFNYNLYLCCLLTYGCLLRPHREIRLLRWHDFDSELRYVSVDGSRVKSKRNRIVPVPQFIRDELVVGNPHDNIFSNTPIEFNEDYFKTLWSRFKKQSKLINRDNTIYSFRHSGAINIFKRTGSITKLQKAMGHSSINVSLTYLRGLEVPELNEEDMPVI